MTDIIKPRSLNGVNFLHLSLESKSAKIALLIIQGANFCFLFKLIKRQFISGEIFFYENIDLLTVKGVNQRLC